MTKKGRKNLAKAMCEPLRRSLNYSGIGRLILSNLDDLQREDMVSDLKFKDHGLSNKYTKPKRRS